LATALLNAALDYSGAARGAVLFSEGGELLAKADASFPRERTKVFASQPPGEFRLPPELWDEVLASKEAVIRHGSREDAALIDPTDYLTGRDTNFLCFPLINKAQPIGLLYLESSLESVVFTQQCLSIVSILASQTAVSFESAQLFEALRETNMWMAKGQQIGRMGSYRWNMRTLMSRVSRECYRIFDISPDINPVPFEIFKQRVHADDLPALDHALGEAIRNKSPFSHEYRIVHEDGAILHVLAVGHLDLDPHGDLELEGIITDVTKPKAVERALTDTQAELVRVARLASLGELAGSIVHEINQPLTGVITSAEACLRWLARDPAELGGARSSAMRVVKEGRRASAVVSGLRSLVRDAHLLFAEMQINDAVEEVLALSNREFEQAHITIETGFDMSIPKVEADRVLLQQVILNLVRNAIDAMAGIVERPRVLVVSSAVYDGHASVTVADNGVGIDPKGKERLFEALYTTKSGGLGLGLSICLKIIRAHGGNLWVQENTPHGAAFTFAIPLRQAVQSPENDARQAMSRSS
jgi:signal transduction histidine kinase